MSGFDFFGWERGIVFACAASLAIFKFKPALLKLAVFWAIFSALRLFAFPVTPYGNESIEWQTVLDSSAATSLLTLSVYALAVWSVPLTRQLRFWQWVAVINWVLIIGGACFTDPGTAPYGYPWGVLLNPSMSGCFTAALLPLLVDLNSRPTWYFPWVSLAGSLLAIYLTHTCQPLACVGVLLSLHFLRKGELRRAVCGPLIGLFFAWLYLGEKLVNSDGRVSIWREAFKWWKLKDSLFIGAGSGSFNAVGPYLSRNFGEKSLFIWLHSDWGQILFEQGIVGLIIAIAIIFKMLRATYRDSPFFYSIAVYAVWMVANMPIRYPLPALFGLFLIRWSFDRSRAAPEGPLESSRA